MMMIRILVFCGLFVPSIAMGQAKKPPVAKKPVAGSKTPDAQKAVPAVTDGKQLYQTYCLVCHQVDGSGVGSLNPPLVKEWVAGDKSRLIRMLLKGSNGKVEIDGDTFSNTMPPQTNFNDQQIAAVLTYVRSNFGNKASAVKPAEVKSVRAKTK